MAIRFVDVESEKGEDARPGPRPRATRAVPESTSEPVEHAPAAEAEAPAGDEAPLSGLLHAKPEPKVRGRKKPMSAAGAGKPNGADAPAAPLLDGLLPELQAHAKPTPKPRGRKKAFG